MRWRVLLVILGLPLAVLTAGCRKTTEIVLKIETEGTPQPAEVTVRLHKPFPYDAPPEMTPSFVVSALERDGDLDLIVQPQGADTVLSLLPPSDGSTYDLYISLLVPPGFSLDPVEAQEASWVPNKALEVLFRVNAPTSDDAGIPPDFSFVRDMATGSAD